MNRNHHPIVMTALLVSLGSLASAQLLGSAARGATSAATQVALPPAPPPPPPPPPPPAPAVSAGAAAQSAASAASAVRAPMGSSAAMGSAASSAIRGSNSGVNATSPAAGAASMATPAGHAATHAITDPSVSASESGVNAGGSASAAASGQVKDVSFAQGSTHRASVSVDRAETVSQIRGAAFAQRDAVTAEIQGRVDASAAALARLEARANQAGEKSRAAFAKLLVEARAREKEVRASLREAAKASQEEAWGKIQSELAQDYGAYAEIVARAEATAGADVDTK